MGEQLRPECRIPQLNETRRSKEKEAVNTLCSNPLVGARKEKSATASLFYDNLRLISSNLRTSENTVSAFVRVNTMTENQSSLVKEKSHLDKLRVSSNSECVAVAGSNPKPITTTSLFSLLG